MTDATTDPYAALMAAVEATHKLRSGWHDTEGDTADVRREAERLVLGQQIAVLERCAEYPQHHATHRDGPGRAVCFCAMCAMLAELRAALAALDGAS